MLTEVMGGLSADHTLVVHYQHIISIENPPNDSPHVTTDYGNDQQLPDYV